MSHTALADAAALLRPPPASRGLINTLDAARFAAAGASLLQLYSALVFQGPGLVARIKRELLACLERDGFANVTDAVGTGAV